MSDRVPDMSGVTLLGACDNYTPSSSGGAEKAAHELYRRFGSAGAAVSVVSVPHGQPYDDPGVSVVRARGLDLSRFVGGYASFSPDSFRVARRAYRTTQPHVLHANTIHYNACVAMASMARRHRVPFVLTAQLGAMSEMPFLTRTAASAYERSVGRYIVSRATSVLAVSRSVREHVISLGAEPSTVTVVENGVDHERFTCADLLESDPPYVLSVGRLVENKGPHLLVSAVRTLALQGREVHLSFLGDGPLRPRLENEVHAAGISHLVTFHGQVPDVEAWLARFAIVVRPSFTEGLPLAVLEAMAAGRCNIVSDIKPNRELVTHGETGLLFRSGDPLDLADKLWMAVDDPPLRVQLGMRAREASKSRSWERMAATTAQVMLDLIASDRSRSA